MNIINLSSEALELVNQLCDPDNLEDKITVLDIAEEQLQKLAFDEVDSDNQVNLNLYTVAYQVKMYKKDLLKLKKLLKNGKEKRNDC
jgi:hypothetical protein